MSAELSVSTTTGAAVYAIVVDSTGTGGGKYFNLTTGGMEVFNAANWSDYMVPLVEDAGTGFYRANMPGLSSGHRYDVVYYSGAGAVGDTKIAGVAMSVGSEGWMRDLSLEV